MLVDSEPINQPSSSSRPSPSVRCSCYGLQPALAPLPFVRWLTPSPSTGPPRPPRHRPVHLRASAAAATGCSLPWRPSPSSAGCLRAHQPALLIVLFVSEPLLQLPRTAACLGSPPLRPLVDSEPINQTSSPSSSSYSSPSLCCSCHGLQHALAPLPFVRWLTPSPSTGPPRPPRHRPVHLRASAAAAADCLGAPLRPLVDSEPINQPSSSPCSSPSLCCSCYGLLPSLAPLPFVRWLTPSPSASSLRPSHHPGRHRAAAAAAADCLGAPPLRPLVDSEPVSQLSSSSCSSPSLCCSCYGLLPSSAPPSFACWLTPSPSTSPPHLPALRRASAAAATGCSLPWRPSPSLAG